jgi:cystathionine beta-lyase/cystathionine gamma-synthase
VVQVAVRVLSHVVEKGEVALVFVSGMADIEDMHTLLMEVGPHVVGRS